MKTAKNKLLIIVPSLILIGAAPLTVAAITTNVGVNVPCHQDTGAACLTITQFSGVDSADTVINSAGALALSLSLGNTKRIVVTLNTAPTLRDETLAIGNQVTPYTIDAIPLSFLETGKNTLTITLTGQDDNALEQILEFYYYPDTITPPNTGDDPSAPNTGFFGAIGLDTPGATISFVSVAIIILALIPISIHFRKKTPTPAPTSRKSTPKSKK
jgi:hypothetical protein